jgi:hydroxylamine reductase (hybrid-cluster protein)
VIKIQYNTERKNAFMVIDEAFKEGKTRQEIYFKIQTMFGFGKNLVDSRLNLLEDLIAQGKL